jgi:hypothetical protein
MLMILAGVANAGAKETKWKLIDLVVILGFAGLGVATTKL